jgi:hypothetical protein
MKSVSFVRIITRFARLCATLPGAFSGLSLPHNLA